MTPCYTRHETAPGVHVDIPHEHEPTQGGAMNYILEIEAEGLPRYVGPFAYKFQAEEWASAHVRNGSWSVIQTTRPNAAVTP